MNDEQWDDFEQWFEMQPNTVSYTECRSFLASYLSLTNGEAEVEMARLSADEKIKVVQTYKASGTPRRIFLLPLDSLTESDIRKVYDGQFTEKNITEVAKGVQDRTGHDVVDVVQYIESLDSVDISGETFKWSHAE